MHDVCLVAVDEELEAVADDEDEDDAHEHGSHVHVPPLPRRHRRQPLIILGIGLWKEQSGWKTEYFFSYMPVTYLAIYCISDSVTTKPWYRVGEVTFESNLVTSYTSLVTVSSVTFQLQLHVY